MSIESGALTGDQRTELRNYEVGRFALEGWTVSSVAGFQAVLQRILNRRIESLILTVDHAVPVSFPTHRARC